MNRDDRDFSVDLGDLPVPQHRTGFWEDVEAELSRIDPRPVVPGRTGDGEIVELKQPEPPRQRVSPWLAASAAAAIVLVLGGATAVLTRPAADPDAVATPEATVGQTGVDSMSGTVTTAAAAPLGRAPWEGPRLRAEDVPAVYADVWDQAENQRWCSALAPLTLASLGNDATPRPADFAGGWAVAWDRPEGPGQQPDGSDCEDCGRSAFGIAGTAVLHEPDTGESLTATMNWADGSFATIGPEGADTTGTKLLANIVIAGQGCRYQVWSNLGEEHLRRLVQNLRLVEGMIARPVELRTASDPPQTVTRGAPPWAGATVDATTASDLVFAKWEELGISGPQLVLASVGEELEGAEVRTWGAGIAWNTRSGPGHTGSNQPCVACGRGTAGIGWQPSSDTPSTGPSLPNRIEWVDGSVAEYGGRTSDPALPRDRVLYFDPETGEPTVDALQAVVSVEGSDYDLVVWSHLGEDHLLFLIDQLRWFVPTG